MSGSPRAVWVPNANRILNLIEKVDVWRRQNGSFKEFEGRQSNLPKASPYGTATLVLGGERV
ncbi:uncharacterized protein FOMMEDRAFT_161777 [Fomitiporia mediterranea MF3/22]|uniref:uncharacterized protein n=1 Tax=Fomitiporia mediterranea (strain MF3/22) TaxID=694068 RepID=UPI0004408987|nr:uncharacterized protein FOMMEDRAFT_161777 [Fomitiporia mediterranea MF3/22]EJC98401.1 hypothetical protein FOMMEDRAFT_161777 [Fomitiporia mediterranea MF3/22]